MPRYMNIYDVGECQEIEFPTEIEMKVGIPHTQAC
jgi:hypothetical protein